MQRVTFANQKGGAGKTTTAVSVAGALAERGQRVLLIDCDPQWAATRWLGAKPDDGLRQVMARERGRPKVTLQELAIETAGGIDLVPASLALAAIDVVASNPQSGVMGVESALARAVDELEGADWDWVLMDTPPNLGMATIAAPDTSSCPSLPARSTSRASPGSPSSSRTSRKGWTPTSSSPPTSRAA